MAYTEPGLLVGPRRPGQSVELASITQMGGHAPRLMFHLHLAGVLDHGGTGTADDGTRIWNSQLYRADASVDHFSPGLRHWSFRIGAAVGDLWACRGFAVVEHVLFDLQHGLWIRQDQRADAGTSVLERLGRKRPSSGTSREPLTRMSKKMEQLSRDRQQSFVIIAMRIK